MVDSSSLLNCRSRKGPGGSNPSLSATLSIPQASSSPGRGVRVADRAALLKLCTARYRGFESLPLRTEYIVSEDPSAYTASGFSVILDKN